ncbi:distal tail protein Dit [Enterococcus italicus]|uniref:distal tail protein Dit n=1 Tax=Enterococcus italicus TaxID=246144 RepID=UPI0028AF7671|nr:distal tail protein Dit [Enterococcus italicus]
MISVTFDGHDLTQYFEVLRGFQRNVGSEWENTVITNNISDGSKFKKNRLKSKVIPVPFVAKYDLNTKRREIAKILNVKTPKKLIFSDEPNFYYEAIPDGSIDLDEIVFLGKGTINFLVPDGIAHAIASKTYTQDSPEFDTDTFTINNEGTYRSWPILEATMPADNGVVAFINDRGKILQFGNPDEDDTRSYNVSDRVVWDKPLTAAQEASRGWKTNSYTFSGIFLNRYNLRVNGTRKFGDGYVTYDNLGTGTGMQGFSYGRKVSADSNGAVGATDFEFKAGFWFETSNYNQTGMMMAELRDASGNAICSIAFYKLSQSNNAGKIRINVQGLIYDYNFQTNSKNIHTSKGKEFSVVKSGNTITFHSGGAKNGGIIKTVRLDALKSMVMTDVVFYVGKVALTNPMARMCITHCTVRKDKVKKTDVKNLFGAGDVLTVDTASGTVALNDLETQIGAFGNDWEGFYLEPGENKIKCIYSDWAQAPTFKITNQEAYL